MFRPDLRSALWGKHVDLGSSGVWKVTRTLKGSFQSVEITRNKQSKISARAFHIVQILFKNDLWTVVDVQGLIKNKVISGLLTIVYLIVFFPTTHPRDNSWINFDTPSYDPKEEYHVNVFVQVCQGKVNLNKPILVQWLRMKWKIENVFWSSSLNPLEEDWNRS